MVTYVHAVQLAVAATGSYVFFPPEIPVAGQAGVDIFFVISGVIIAKTAVGLSWQDPLPIDLIILISVAACVFFAWRIHLAIEMPLLNALKGKPRLTLAQSGGVD